MKVGVIGGYMMWGSSSTTASRTAATATSSRDRAADDLDLQRIGVFLRRFREEMDATRTALGTTGRTRHRGRLTLTGSAPLALGSTTSAAQLRGSLVLGGTPASYTPATPDWSAAPRALPTVGGAYDGSNGTQALTVVATQGGIVGSDTLQFDVRDEAGTTLEQLTIDGTYTAGDDIALANGLTLQLGAGDVHTGASLELAVSSETAPGSGSFSPAAPAWTAAARPALTLGGDYDGSNGAQRLTLRVAAGGRVGSDDVQLELLDQDGAVLELVDVAAGYEPGGALTLTNGLTVALDDGALGTGDTFAFDVSYDDGTGTGTATPVDSAWTTASVAAATVGGTYDGSSGTQSLTVSVAGGGVVGQDDLLLNVLDADGATLEQVAVGAGYEPGTGVAMANGLTLSLGAGTLTTGDSLGLSVAWEEGSTQNTFTSDDAGWQDGSPPAATLAGAYDGSNGTQTLTLRVAQGGVVGGDEILIDVLDQDGATLEQLAVGIGYEPGTGVTLANGLRLELAGGRLVTGDELAVDVAAATELDPAAAFDGGGGEPPAWLQGATIGDGSFTLNGVQIDVFATDSLATVLERLNGADAGVTAALDTGSGRVVLTQSTPGADGDITLADDTSGLLAALGLDDGAFTPGGSGDFASPLDQVAALAGVRSGTLVVNGHAVTLDAGTDSLDDLRARLADLGVNLDYDADAGRMSLRTRGAVTLDDGGTGFFAALGIAPGAHADPDGARGFASPDRIAGQLRDLAATWNGVFTTSRSETAATQLERLDTSLQSALKSYVVGAGGSASGSTLRSGFGLDFRVRPDGTLEIAIDDQALAHALSRDARGIEVFLTGRPTGLGDGRTTGLLDVLGSTLRATETAVDTTLRARGLSVVDLYA